MCQRPPDAEQTPLCANGSSTNHCEYTCQPMYDVHVQGDRVMVDTDSRCVRIEPTAGRPVETAEAGEPIA